MKDGAHKANKGDGIFRRYTTGDSCNRDENRNNQPAIVFQSDSVARFAFFYRSYFINALLPSCIQNSSPLQENKISIYKITYNLNLLPGKSKK